MYKPELIERMAEYSEFTKKKTEVALDAFLTVVGEALARGEDVYLHGFGKFAAVERKATVGHNFHTNEKVIIAAKKAPVFRFSDVFKKSLNEANK